MNVTICDTRTQLYAHAHVKHARACVFLCAHVSYSNRTRSHDHRLRRCVWLNALTHRKTVNKGKGRVEQCQRFYK